jgi:Txe/YoeB family toxin of Txe-Axe toxin-antitoxin module
MEIIYQPKAVEDLKYWKKSGQKQVQAKILTTSSNTRKPFWRYWQAGSAKAQLDRDVVAPH